VTAIVPHLSRITIFPIKSLDGVDVTEAALTPGGALQNDRAFCLVDADGKVVNGKRTDKVHLLRAAYDLAAQTVALRVEGSERSHRFHLHQERAELEAWFDRYFGFPVLLRHNTITGFPDDPYGKGPTVIGAQTLTEITSWFSGLTAEDVRRRFRANLEIGDVPPFWEDRLYAEEGSVVQFAVGAVMLEGMMPWPRCVVPSRDPQTGKENHAFQRRFAQRREATMPAWTPRARFDHFYKLCVTTQVPRAQTGMALRVGDEVRILGSMSPTPAPPAATCSGARLPLR
jgi:uncharacterized protein YcbX